MLDMTRTILRTAAGVKAIDARGDAGRIRALQRRRLRELVEHARTWSPLYAQLYGGLPDHVDDVTDLPVVTKPHLMANFDAWVTDPMVTRAGVDDFVADPSRIGEPYLGRYLVGTTSGTTGRPAIILADEATIAIGTGVAAIRRRTGVDSLAVVRSGVRMAMLVATGGHFMAAAELEFFRRRSSWFFEHYRLLSVQAPMSELVRELNACQPTILGGYATVLVELASEARAGRLRIDPVVVMSSAETLSPPDRAGISATFGAPVREVYGSSELLHAAFECDHGTLHVSEDWAILEPVDDEYRPVPIGTPSTTVLVTNLANRVQPIIRYDLGDAITVLARACACGSPLMGVRPVGRTDDTLSLPGRSGDEVRILPLALATVVEETPGVLMAQVRHVPPDELRFRLATEPGRHRDDVAVVVRDRVRAWLATQGVDDVALTLDDAPPARNPVTGKYRAVSVEREPVTMA
jgi:phenylacetate-CoA ligase